MKKYIAVLVFLLSLSIFFSGCSRNTNRINDLEKIKKRGYLIAGVKNDSPPFGYYDKNGNLTGIDVQIAQRIANEIFKNDLPSNIRLVPVETQKRIATLNSGDIDILVATLSVNRKRKLILDFSKPYYAISQKIMVPKTSKITHLQYFNSNGVIAVIQGATGSKNVRRFAPNARIVTVNTHSDAFRLLESGSVDAIFSDDSILQGLNYNNRYKVVNHAYSRELYAVAVRKSGKSKELIELINNVIADVLDDKNMNLIKNRYIFY